MIEVKKHGQTRMEELKLLLLLSLPQIEMKDVTATLVTKRFVRRQSRQLSA